ncbi:hypothetical protein ABZW18_00680 [Streptomyces sp. NPDC004647]|uniref:hypothetical protein n=1 Tax=Streptomyces sp. NPDC004647 TaxID=3154671 RepID=UPI0033AA32A5
MTTAACTYSASELTDAACLVSLGCQPRLRPLALPRYWDLLQRYRLDGAFRDAVDAVAEGLDMDLIEAHPIEGLVLHPREGSWLAYRLKDHPRLGVKDRLVLGLAHVAIAARAYPTPADLEEETVKRVSLAEVDDFLRSLTERLREAAVDADGLAVPHAELDAAWRVYSKLPPARPTTTGRLSESSTHRVIKEALEWLVEQGLANRAPELGVGCYRLAHRFRLQVRETAAMAAFAALCDIRRAQLIEED